MKTFTILMLVTAFSFSFVITGYSQGCGTVSVEKDPFTKEVTSTTSFQTLRNNFLIGFRMVNSSQYIRVNYGKDIGSAILTGEQANLPYIDNSTSLWLLLDDNSVIRLNYQDERVIATDPRKVEGRNLTTIRLGGFQMRPRDNYGRRKPYYVFVTGEFILSQNEFSKLKTHAIKMARLEQRDTRIDAELSNQDFIMNALKCIDQTSNPSQN